MILRIAGRGLAFALALCCLTATAPLAKAKDDFFFLDGYGVTTGATRLRRGFLVASLPVELARCFRADYFAADATGSF